MNNMRNLGLAVLGYAGSTGAYPGFLNELPTNSAVGAFDGKVARVTVFVSVLPFLERSDVYTLYRNPHLDATSGADPREIYLDILTCPLASATEPRKSSPPPCNYIVNTGCPDVVASAGTSLEIGYPADWKANGIFFNRYRDLQNPLGAPLVSTSQDYISSHDGSSLTVMLSERPDAGSYSFPPASALVPFTVNRWVGLGVGWALPTTDSWWARPAVQSPPVILAVTRQ